MEEWKAILLLIPFWIREKIQLRGFYGKSRPNNWSSRKRNDEFYEKLEKELLPILQSNNYFKKRKRIFIKIEGDKVFYVNFALNKKLNGMCVDYGELNKTTHNNTDEIIRQINSHYTSQRLRPDFWKFDYQYPVRQADSYDERMIFEIKHLLLKKMK